MPGSPRTLLYVSAILGIIVVLISGYVVRKRRLAAKTEVELVQQLRATTEAPSPDVSAPGALEGPDAPPELAARLLSVGRTFQGPLSDCHARWPGGPGDARLFLQTDAAGRIEDLQIQGAPEAAAGCILAVLERGQWPRNAAGVATLPLVR